VSGVTLAQGPRRHSRRSCPWPGGDLLHHRLRGRRVKDLRYGVSRTRCRSRVIWYDGAHAVSPFRPRSSFGAGPVRPSPAASSPGAASSQERLPEQYRAFTGPCGWSKPATSRRRKATASCTARSRHAADARPHSSFLDPDVRADARAPARALLRLGSPSRSSTATSRREPLRRIAGIPQGRAPRRRHRQDRRRGREGLDERTGRARFAGPRGRRCGCRCGAAGTTS